MQKPRLPPFQYRYLALMMRINLSGSGESWPSTAASFSTQCWAPLAPRHSTPLLTNPPGQHHKHSARKLLIDTLLHSSGSLMVLSPCCECVYFGEGRSELLSEISLGLQLVSLVEAKWCWNQKKKSKQGGTAGIAHCLNYMVRNWA